MLRYVRRALEKAPAGDGLCQRGATLRMGICKETYANWEKDKTMPVAAQFYPVVTFLDHAPVPAARHLQGACKQSGGPLTPPSRRSSATWDGTAERSRDTSMAYGRSCQPDATSWRPSWRLRSPTLPAFGGCLAAEVPRTANSLSMRVLTDAS